MAAILRKIEMTNRLLKPNEMAEILSVSEQTLANLRSRGVGPEYIKLGPGKRAPVRYPSVQNIANIKRDGGNDV